MAAASPLNLAPPERKLSLGIPKQSTRQPHSIAMHVTRPKSAKGRTRQSLNFSHSVEAYSYQAPLSPQPIAPCEEAVSGRRVASSQQLYQPTQASSAEIPDLLQQVPLRTSSSLNKYRVLPSISRKDLRKSAVEVMSEQAGQLQVSSQPEKDEPLGKGPAPLVATKHAGGCGEYAQSPPLPLETKPAGQARPAASPALNLEEPSEKELRLLLAIRSPSGQRFERHFRPTDSLETVLVAAERKNSAVYARCSIETVEVPRRTFSDLSKTLQECAIPHKSVLCILQEGEP
ncbi:UBX domain-containing protein 10 [Hemicordylus capensis]|uniref:UBX domain-containing protein 10 n=1 Tax=Hemicordylus capensis TaxID=884348 RepID=UPI0023025D3B|nr:UBX domain-containing protein 10 [Hemicordylus capensis]XP_053137346.1 UBX domain-containing protein 10 [Hemicordylus capensis]XP_053137347.1 UBX domain-containing protein 10 [Hemicordylus capensis]